MKMISREDLKQRVMGHFCGSCSMPYKDANLELDEYCCDMVSDTIAFIDGLPTIEAQPVGTEKCKALRNIESIRLILSNVYNTGSTLQDCDYDAIYKRLDVIENILKGE